MRASRESRSEIKLFATEESRIEFSLVSLSLTVALRVAMFCFGEIANEETTHPQTEERHRNKPSRNKAACWRKGKIPEPSLVDSGASPVLLGRVFRADTLE
jgi:hypothetical protein